MGSRIQIIVTDSWSAGMEFSPHDSVLSATTTTWTSNNPTSPQLWTVAPDQSHLQSKLVTLAPRWESAPVPGDTFLTHMIVTSMSTVREMALQANSTALTLPLPVSTTLRKFSVTFLTE